MVAVPPTVVTATLFVPAVFEGDVAVIWDELSTLKLDAAVPPKLTAVAPEKLAPEITTTVPPDRGPDDGLTELMVGGET